MHSPPQVPKGYLRSVLNSPLSVTYLYLQLLLVSNGVSLPKFFSPALRPSNMYANLQALSVEIIELLARDLQCPDLCSLRLVSRNLYKKSLRVFTKLLDVVKTDLSAQSLKRLADIANSDHLAPHVHTLRFWPDQEGALGRGFEWSRNTAGGLADPLADAYFMLQDILRNQLVNCRSFYIKNYDEVGMSKENSWLTPGDVVSIIYSFVINANLRIMSFTIESEGSCGRLSTERLLAPSLYHAEEHQREPSSWTSLNSLLLRFNLTEDQYDWALALLKNASGIRELSLRVNPGEEATLFPRLTALGLFDALESLTLDCIRLNGTSLSRFLLQHRNTVQRLTLRNLRLESDDSEEEGGMSWDAVFKSLMGKMDRLNYISLFFIYERYTDHHRARDLYPSPSMDDGSSTVPGSEEPIPGHGRVRADARMVATLESPVQFRYKHYRGDKRPYGATYQGTDMDQFFDLVIRALKSIK